MLKNMLTSNMPRLEPRFHQVDLIGLASNCDLESLLACAKMRCDGVRFAGWFLFDDRCWEHFGTEGASKTLRSWKHPRTSSNYHEPVRNAGNDAVIWWEKPWAREGRDISTLAQTRYVWGLRLKFETYTVWFPMFEQTITALNLSFMLNHLVFKEQGAWSRRLEQTPFGRRHLSNKSNPKQWVTNPKICFGFPSPSSIWVMVETHRGPVSCCHCQYSMPMFLKNKSKQDVTVGI